MMGRCNDGRLQGRGKSAEATKAKGRKKGVKSTHYAFCRTRDRDFATSRNGFPSDNRHDIRPRTSCDYADYSGERDAKAVQMLTEARTLSESMDMHGLTRWIDAQLAR